MNELKETLLKEIAVSQTGPFGSQLHKEDYVEIGTPIVTVEHLGEIGFILDNLPMVSNEDKKRLSKYILQEGDIVFSRVGSIDRCTYVSEKEEGWLFSGRCLRVRFNKKAHSKYISYYFRQKFFKKLMLNISVGAIMPSLNTSLMNNVPLFLPPKDTQQKIAAVLSALDEKIELNQRINAELEAMAKTIYEYWFVQFDFPNEAGRPYKSSGGKMVWNEQLKREIPEGWEVKGVSDLLPILTGKEDSNFSTPKGSFPFFTCSNKVLACNEYAFEGKAVLLAGNGNFNIKRYNGKFNAYQRTYVLIPENESYYTVLFYAVEDSISQLTKGARGSIVKFITKGDIENIKLVLPKSGYENLFFSLNKIVEQISNYSLQSQTLAEVRDWLLPMLMNGQVRVG